MIHYSSYIQNVANKQVSLISSSNDSLKQSSDTELLNSGLKEVKREQGIIHRISEGYDATSYYYVQSSNTAPIADYFLNPNYFPLRRTEITSETKNSENYGISSNKFALKQSDVLLLVLLGLAALIAYVRFSTHDYIKRITLSVFSFAYVRTLYNDRTKLLFVKDFILQIVFYISSGIFAIHLAFYFHLIDDNKAAAAMYFIFPLIIFGFILFYRIFIWFLGVLTNSEKIVFEYLYYFGNSLKFLGIFNVIVLFALLFGTQSFQIYLIYLSFFVYISLYFIRLYKIFLDFLSNRFSLFYFILYFCALEIVPIMILIKQISILSGTEFVF
jgi:hypothetical protein